MALEKLGEAIDRWRAVVEAMKAAGEQVRKERAEREAKEAEEKP